jgi:hypothetical protein
MREAPSEKIFQKLLLIYKTVFTFIAAYALKLSSCIGASNLRIFNPSNLLEAFSPISLRFNQSSYS